MQLTTYVQAVQLTTYVPHNTKKMSTVQLQHPICGRASRRIALGHRSPRPYGSLSLQGEPLMKLLMKSTKAELATTEFGGAVGGRTCTMATTEDLQGTLYQCLEDIKN